jgi:hypothetical protein
VVPLHLLVIFLVGWLQHEQHQVIQYLCEENRILKARLRPRRVRFTDEERRRLAAFGAPLGRRILSQVATIVTPGTILRCHRRVPPNPPLSLGSAVRVAVSDRRRLHQPSAEPNGGPHSQYHTTMNSGPRSLNTSVPPEATTEMLISFSLPTSVANEEASAQSASHALVELAKMRC